jgi:phosphoglycolate phosphatase-like HAD superfamily hydrolase
MMLIHPPVNPYSQAREIREWIEVLERWRTEPIEDEQDLWFIDSHLTNAREWLERAEKKELPTGAAPPA